MGESKGAEEILEHVYGQFLLTGSWPLVRELQLEYRDLGDFRTIAARIGADRIICQENPTGVCYLPIAEISVQSESSADMARFCDALRLAASIYAREGPSPLTSQICQRELSLEGAELRRLGAMLSLDTFLWSSVGGAADFGTFSFTPNERILFFHGVRDYGGYTSTISAVQAQESERYRLRDLVRQGSGTVVGAATAQAESEHPGTGQSEPEGVTKQPLLTHRLNAWIRAERKARGELWLVIATLLGLALAAAAVF